MSYQEVLDACRPANEELIKALDSLVGYCSLAVLNNHLAVEHLDKAIEQADLARQYVILTRLAATQEIIYDAERLH